MSTADDNKYISDAQQRILGLLLVLSDMPVDGLSKGQMAQLNQCTPSDVTRDFANLVHAGFAEVLPQTGRCRLGPKLVQISINHATALARAQARLDEVTNRFSRG